MEQIFMMVEQQEYEDAAAKTRDNHVKPQAQTITSTATYNQVVVTPSSLVAKEQGTINKSTEGTAKSPEENIVTSTSLSKDRASYCGKG